MSVTALTSESIHRNLVDGVLLAPLSFFFATPTGRIISRFSGDINRIDTEFPQMLLDILGSSLSIVLAVVFTAPVSPCSYAQECFLIFLVLFCVIVTRYLSLT